MTLRLIIVATALLISVTAHAAQKMDILGFSPGMSDDDMHKRLIELKCSVPCVIDGGSVEFEMTKELVTQRLKRVIYKVKSGLKPREMIEYISKQYGVQTLKSDIGNIDRATMGHVEDVAFIGRTLLYGGYICRWSLPNKLELHLDLAMPGDVSEYNLFLTSTAIDQEESAVIQGRKDKERAAREGQNRQPKL